jgi:hypothetical protein
VVAVVGGANFAIGSKWLVVFGWWGGRWKYIYFNVWWSVVVVVKYQKVVGSR